MNKLGTLPNYLTPVELDARFCIPSVECGIVGSPSQILSRPEDLDYLMNQTVLATLCHVLNVSTGATWWIEQNSLGDIHTTGIPVLCHSLRCNKGDGVIDSVKVFTIPPWVIADRDIQQFSTKNRVKAFIFANNLPDAYLVWP